MVDFCQMEFKWLWRIGRWTYIDGQCRVVFSIFLMNVKEFKVNGEE